MEFTNKQKTCNANYNTKIWGLHFGLIFIRRAFLTRGARSEEAGWDVIWSEAPAASACSRHILCIFSSCNRVCSCATCRGVDSKECKLETIRMHFNTPGIGKHVRLLISTESSKTDNMHYSSYIFLKCSLAVIDNLLLLVLDVTLLHLWSPLLQTLWRHKIKRPTPNPPKKKTSTDSKLNSMEVRNVSL